MRRRRLPALPLVGLLLLAGCGPPETATDPAAELAALADEAWRERRAQSPYLQVRTGGLIGELPDLTPEQAARDAAFARTVLSRLDAIPEEPLSHQDALTAAILRWDAERVLDLEPHHWLTFPYSPYVAGQTLAFVHGQLLAHPFSDPEAHTANYLLVLSEYAQSLEQLRAHVEGQVERDIYVSRHALPGILGMLRSFAAQAPAVMSVSDDRLEELEPEARRAFQAAVDEAIEDRVVPAFEALVAALGSEEYAAKAPDAVGLSQYPGGEALYRKLVKLHTTMDVTPEELHELGRRRLGEIEAEMAAIRDELGFEGTKQEFHEKLRTDPRFFDDSPEEVEARFQAYVDRIEPLLPQWFRTTPAAPYGVERLDPAAEATMTFGYYAPPTPDEPVGRYRYNASKLDERPQIWAGPLIYHELVPGHHFQIALQDENDSLPLYRRHYLQATAFVEGWGNYAAQVAREMGLLADPYDRYGALLFDAFVCNRLVVDTGMNLMGWPLEQGREHMREHTFQSETEIATETLRYSTDLFAQALAYRAGHEKLLALRERARALAGEAFDVRDYHDAVLASGAMPLSVLDEHVEWSFAGPR